MVAQLVKAALHRTLVLFFFDDVLSGCEGLGDVEWAGRLVCDSAVIIMRQGAAAHKRSWGPSILAEWGVHQARVCEAVWRRDEKAIVVSFKGRLLHGWSFVFKLASSLLPIRILWPEIPLFSQVNTVLILDELLSSRIALA